MATIRATLTELTEELKAWKLEKAELLKELETAKAGSQTAAQLQQELQEATERLSGLQTQLEAAQAQLSKSGEGGDQSAPPKGQRQEQDPPNPKNPPPPKNRYEIEML